MVKYTKTYNKLSRKPVKKRSRFTGRIPSNKKMYGQQKQTFCKVCYDCHKPPEMYLSHRPKIGYGPNAVTICPTLLNTRCPNCGNLGHTGSNCPQHKDKHQHQHQYQHQRQHYPVKKPYYTIRKYVPPSPSPTPTPTPTTSPTTTTQPNNLFDILHDEDEHVEELHTKNNQPIQHGNFISSNILSIPSTTITYAQIASTMNRSETTKQLDNIVKLFKQNIGICKREEEKKEEPEEKEIEFDELKYISTRSWADIMDDEEDDDNDDIFGIGCIGVMS